jgi:hypothetical protein
MPMKSASAVVEQLGKPLPWDRLEAGLMVVAHISRAYGIQASRRQDSDARNACRGQDCRRGVGGTALA